MRSLNLVSLRFLHGRKTSLISASTGMIFLLIQLGCGGSSTSSNQTNNLVVENLSPVINIEQNMSVNEQETVELIAQISDTDGQVATIHWRQISGTSVVLSSTNEAQTSFVAPQVTSDTLLEFELSATDDDGDTTTVQIDVTVINSIEQLELFSVGGNASGVEGTVELQLNNNEILAITENGNFTFANQLEQGQSYSVSIHSFAEGYSCSLINNTGVVSSNIEDILLTCQIMQISECNDGIDNDNDGLVDWIEDLGCSSQFDSSEGGKSNHSLENGWTLFEPPEDSLIYYVSSSDGNDDTHSGLSASEPFETYAKAISVARNNHPDWILLKRGDVFVENILVNSGRSQSEPFIVSSYGESNLRPLLKVGSSDGIEFPQNFAFIAVIGLDFYAHTRNPEDVDYVDSSGGLGFRIWRQQGMAGNDVLIENSAFRYFVLSVSQGQSAPENISIRRNIFEYNYSTNSHSQGMYSRGTINLIFEENIMDHNGWLIQSFDEGQSEGQATKFNHNTYFNSIDGLIYRRNAIMRGASMGSKFTAQTQASELLIDNNLYLDNEIGIGMGQNYEHPYRFDHITISDNLFTNMGQSRPTNRTLGWAVQLDGLDESTIENNYIVNSTDTLVQNTFAFEVFANQRNLSIQDNTIHGISATNNRGLIRLYGDGSQQNINLNNNLITSSNDERVLIEMEEASIDNFLFDSNTYFSNRAASSWFEIDNQDIDYSDWILANGENGATDQMPNYCDIQRSIEAYQSSIGETPLREAFINNIKRQGKFHWDPRYEVDVVNQWVKDGFAVCL